MLRSHGLNPDFFTESLCWGGAVWNMGWRGLEFGSVELHVSADVGGDFGAFGDVSLPCMKKKGRGGNKYQAGSDDGSGVASALDLRCRETRKVLRPRSG